MTAQGKGTHSYESDAIIGPTTSIWALGFIAYASLMMGILGGFHIINGMSAVLDDSFYTVRPGFGMAMDITLWGWLHIVGGVVLIIGGIGVLSGTFWARVVGIVCAVSSAVWNFYSMPYYPIWSFLMLMMAIGVIWALTTHSKDLAKDSF